MNILVRNLPREITEIDILNLFQPFGEIRSVSLVLDAATGKSKGFGFVEMPRRSEAVEAIKALNGKLISGERIRVKTTNQPERAQPKHFRDKEEKESGKGKSSGAHSALSKRPTNRVRRKKN
ncbi:MAG: RNA-binding protein [Nitrospirae bacterium]|nr:RNA-binding protein [Nitrospirota bacterium]